jgi:putative tricarboxylic transport membrane protein
VNSFEGLMHGFAIALTFQNLLAAFLGALAGTLVGVLPGLGPLGGIALILPITYSFDPTTGLIAMAGIFYGAMYGGSTTAILINVPGEVASAITCLDGYQLTRKGRAGAALSIVAVGSFVGGTASVLGIMLLSPAVSRAALLFGPAEYFAMLLGGLLIFSRISGGTLAAGLFPMTVGLLLATVGQEAVTGQQRFIFGINELSPGFTLVAVVIGLFAVAEMMQLVATKEDHVAPIAVKLKDMLPTREEWRRSIAPMGRGTIVGFLIGALPGPPSSMSSFASYRLEQAVCRNKDQLGTGAIEGVAGPQPANNAASTATLIPLLAMGIPFGAITALMLSSLMVHGINPGPLLMRNYPDLFWGLIASMYIGNVMLVILNVPMIGLWVTLLRVPQYIFLPVIVLLTIIGAYSVNNSMLDVWMLPLVGSVGFILNKLDFRLAPMVIGLVLGPLVEKHLREALILSDGDISTFWGSPVAVVTWLIVIAVLFLGYLLRPKEVAAED